MANGTTLPSGCYLSVANPPSRDADSGLTMFGWFYVPSFSGYHTTLMLNYATNNVGEGFQFEASSGTVAGGFIMCYPSEYTSLGGSYASGTWYFQAEVFTRSGGVTTRRTYISSTAGATPTLIATQTWTVPNTSPERFDIGEAETFGRTLRGSLQFVGLAPVAMTTAQLAEQSNSVTPVVSCWVFIAGNEGVYTDSSGNSRTVTATGGTPTAASVAAPVAPPLSSAISATAGGPRASATGTVAQPAVSAVVSAAAGGPRASATATISQQQITVAGVSTAGAPTAAIAASLAITLPRVILYGHSVIAGYGLSDPADHIAPKLKALLGSRVEDVVELGYSGETSASLDSNFNSRVDPYVTVGRETIVAYVIAFNSAHQGVSAGDILANIVSVATKARAKGWKAVPMAETKADADSQAHEETLLAINENIQNNWASAADGFVNVRERFYDPTDTTLYQSDGAHITAVGNGVLAELIYREVNRLLLGVSQSTIVAVAASAGAPVASVATTMSVRSAVAARAGGPVSSSSVTLGTPISAAFAAGAGAPLSSGVAIVGEALMSQISAGAGAPIASLSTSLINTFPDLDAYPCDVMAHDRLTLEVRTRITPT